jgi:hypothetical protein
MADFSKTPKISEDAEIIEGSYDKYKDWHMDPKGYLLIRLNKQDKVIELGICRKDNVILKIFRGKIPQEIYYEVSKRDLLSRPEHYAYMGKELEKAYLALKHDIEYVQDEELEIN